MHMHQLTAPYDHAEAREDRYQEIVSTQETEIWDNITDHQEAYDLAEQWISDPLDALADIISIIAQSRKLQLKMQGQTVAAQQATRQATFDAFRKLEGKVFEILTPKAERDAQRIYEE